MKGRLSCCFKIPYEHKQSFLQDSTLMINVKTAYGIWSILQVCVRFVLCFLWMCAKILLCHVLCDCNTVLLVLLVTHSFTCWRIQASSYSRFLFRLWNRPNVMRDYTSRHKSLDIQCRITGNVMPRQNNEVDEHLSNSVSTLAGFLRPPLNHPTQGVAYSLGCSGSWFSASICELLILFCMIL